MISNLKYKWPPPPRALQLLHRSCSSSLLELTAAYCHSYSNLHLSQRCCVIKDLCSGSEEPGCVLNAWLGGTHILRHTGMIHKNGSVFLQEIPRHGSHFSLKILRHGSVLQIFWGLLILTNWFVFMAQSLEMGAYFWKIP